MPKERDYYDPKFYGTENWYKGMGFLYTDSVKSHSMEFAAYWILDVVGSYMDKIRASKEDFLIFTFDVDDSKCRFECKNDNRKIILSQDIEYTDLKHSVKFWMEYDGVHYVLMFPSDH